MEILSKFAAKSLTRFNYVCKLPCSFQTFRFITTKHHPNNFFKTDNNLNLLLLRCAGNSKYRCDGSNSKYCFSVLSTEKGQNFSVKENIHLPIFESWYCPVVFGNCNGLLALHDNAQDDGKVALWNPSTREFKFLPPSPIQRPPFRDSRDCTGFDCLGFGFDSKSEDYKVVRFVTNYIYVDEHTEFLDVLRQVELYSLKTDSWKEISLPNPDVSLSVESLFNNYINGFYYFVALGSSDLLILSFDMANETFSSFPSPPLDGIVAPHGLEFFDFDGLLGCIVYSDEGTEKSFDFWVMNGSWTREFSIENISGVKKPLGFWKNGELFLEGSNHELLQFDPATRELKNLGIHSYEKTIQLIGYVESLVPINGRSEHEENIIRQPVGDASDRY